MPEQGEERESRGLSHEAGGGAEAGTLPPERGPSPGGCEGRPRAQAEGAGQRREGRPGAQAEGAGQRQEGRPGGLAPRTPAAGWHVTGYCGQRQGQIFAGGTLGCSRLEGALAIRPGVPELPRAQRLESWAQAGLAC